MEFNWKNFINSDPAGLPDKAVIKETQLSVGFILGLFADGWTEKQVLEHYPVLTREAMQAVFVFIRDCLIPKTVNKHYLKNCRYTEDL